MHYSGSGARSRCSISCNVLVICLYVCEHGTVNVAMGVLQSMCVGGGSTIRIPDR